MRDRQREHLHDLAAAVAAAMRLAGRHTLASLTADEIAIAALERFIERISEASRRVNASLKEREPAIPWPDIAGIGNVLRHDYDNIDLTILWNIATRDLPPLADAVGRMIRSLEDR